MDPQIILEAFRQDNSYILILILIADADYHYHSYYLMPSDSSHDKKFWYLLNLNLKLIIAIENSKTGKVTAVVAILKVFGEICMSEKPY